MKAFPPDGLAIRCITTLPTVQKCPWRDSNPHALRRRFLKPVCLPFHHMGSMEVSGFEPETWPCKGHVFPTIPYPHLILLFVINLPLVGLFTINIIPTTLTQLTRAFNVEMPIIYGCIYRDCCWDVT